MTVTTSVYLCGSNRSSSIGVLTVILYVSLICMTILLIILGKGFVYRVQGRGVVASTPVALHSLAYEG